VSGAPETALVTGGTSGLGRALCDALAAQGCLVTSIDKATPERDCGFAHIACDLSQRHHLDHALEQALRAGPFDWVVLNAGLSATGKFEEIDPAAHARVLAVNAEAPMVLCAGLMKADAVKSGGHIVFVSSLSHFTGYPGAASYGAAKDAIAVYARSVRKPFGKHFGVSVTCAFPGPLRTDHAARHAPPGANAQKRLPVDRAARRILDDARRKKAVSFLTASSRLVAIGGRFSPKGMTLAMHALIYSKLDRRVED
jgi:NAD(P)-dependent dehydrogenase (short-subunit alcohol dehydrogenase family)